MIAERLEMARLRGVLAAVREALHLANETPHGPICDTIWMPNQPETLFDFIDASLEEAASTCKKKND